MHDQQIANANDFTDFKAWSDAADNWLKLAAYVLFYPIVLPSFSCL
jgi:hypothetical protein